MGKVLSFLEKTRGGEEREFLFMRIKSLKLFAPIKQFPPMTAPFKTVAVSIILAFLEKNNKL